MGSQDIVDAKKISLSSKPPEIVEVDRHLDIDWAMTLPVSTVFPNLQKSNQVCLKTQKNGGEGPLEFSASLVKRGISVFPSTILAIEKKKHDHETHPYDPSNFISKHCTFFTSPLNPRVTLASRFK